jgi:hypothetical protein
MPTYMPHMPPHMPSEAHTGIDIAAGDLQFRLSHSQSSNFSSNYQKLGTVVYYVVRVHRRLKKMP